MRTRDRTGPLPDFRTLSRAKLGLGPNQSQQATTGPTVLDTFVQGILWTFDSWPSGPRPMGLKGPLKLSAH
jgi:hypothetical protein